MYVVQVVVDARECDSHGNVLTFARWASVADADAMAQRWADEIRGVVTSYTWRDRWTDGAIDWPTFCQLRDPKPDRQKTFRPSAAATSGASASAMIGAAS